MENKDVGVEEASGWRRAIRSDSVSSERRERRRGGMMQRGEGEEGGGGGEVEGLRSSGLIPAEIADGESERRSSRRFASIRVLGSGASSS